VTIGFAFATDDIAAYILGFLSVILCVFLFGVLV
jgi:hypothetical protein